MQFRNPDEILVTAPDQPRDVLSAELSKGLDSLGAAGSGSVKGLTGIQAYYVLLDK